MANWITNRGVPGARRRYLGVPPNSEIPVHLRRAMPEDMMPKNWIAGAIKRPGQLHKDLGVPQGEKIPAKKLAMAAKLPGAIGRRARLAQTLGKMPHPGGG